MLSAAAQLSIRSALDNMLTWTTFKLNKPATGEKMSKKKKDIFSVVMTPDRIPKFFIPSLDVEHVFVEGEMAGDTADSIPERPITLEKSLPRTGRRSHSESHLRKDILGERATLRKKTSLCHTGHHVLSDELEKAVDHSDPTTRAALSLPHLPKITTPYGFLTLGESPNIRRKESLFFDHDAMDLRTLLSQRKKRSSPLSRSPSSPLNDGQHRSGGPETASPLRTGRSASCEAIGRIPPLSPLSHSALERCPAKSDKKRFQALMRKHLSGIKSLRSHSGPVEKLPAPVGRTQSNPFA